MTAYESALNLSIPGVISEQSSPDLLRKKEFGMQEKIRAQRNLEQEFHARSLERESKPAE